MLQIDGIRTFYGETQALFDVPLNVDAARSSRCLARPAPARRRPCDRSSA